MNDESKEKEAPTGAGSEEASIDSAVVSDTGKSSSKRLEPADVSAETMRAYLIEGLAFFGRAERRKICREAGYQRAKNMKYIKTFKTTASKLRQNKRDIMNEASEASLKKDFLDDQYATGVLGG